MNKTIKFIAALFAACATLASCSDWTEMKSIKLEEPDIAKQHPEVYAKYLQGLKDFKQTKHKKTYVWFDNTDATPSSRAQHIYDVPDSVDVVVLMNGELVNNYILNDMVDLLKNKGTKVIFDVDFDAIKQEYQLMRELTPEIEPTPEDFREYLSAALTAATQTCTKYYYYGICIRYKGKSKLHLEPKELTDYIANENMFLGFMKDWQERNIDKMIAYAGIPQYVSDKSLFDMCDMVFCSQGLDATSEMQFDYFLALCEGVPEDKIGMMATSLSADPNYPKIGYLLNGQRSIEALGDWAAGANVAGIGIYNVSTDYYSTPTYGYSRRAIQNISPSAH